MSRSARDPKTLKAIGHQLKPIVTVAGKGLTDTILAEIDSALTRHELIKVRLLTAERSEKVAMLNQIREGLGCECLQQIGHVALIYRAADLPDPRLSNVLRHAAVK